MKEGKTKNGLGLRRGYWHEGGTVSRAWAKEKTKKGLGLRRGYRHEGRNVRVRASLKRLS